MRCVRRFTTGGPTLQQHRAAGEAVLETGTPAVGLYVDQVPPAALCRPGHLRRRPTRQSTPGHPTPMPATNNSAPRQQQQTSAHTGSSVLVTCRLTAAMQATTARQSDRLNSDCDTPPAGHCTPCRCRPTSSPRSLRRTGACTRNGGAFNRCLHMEWRSVEQVPAEGMEEPRQSEFPGAFSSSLHNGAHRRRRT